MGQINYSAEETKILHDAIRDILPISGMERELVAMHHHSFLRAQMHTGSAQKNSKSLQKHEFPQVIHPFWRMFLKQRRFDRWCDGIGR
jgi:hypothetical protein